jgi:hypothetical protein
MVLYFIYNKLQKLPLGVLIAVWILVIAVGMFLWVIPLTKFLIRSFKRKPLLTGLCVAEVILSLWCAWSYYFNTVEVPQSNQVVEVRNSRYYVDDGLISEIPMFEYRAYSTRNTQPDKVYSVVLDNGSLQFTDKVVWTQPELRVGQVKVLRHKITELAYGLIEKDHYFGYTITLLKLERSLLYLILPPIYLLLALIGCYFLRRKWGIIVEGEFRELPS